MAAKNFASGSDVRAWATEQGIATGSRGKFSADTIKAYNAAHKSRPFAYGAHVHTVTVQAGRVRRNVSVKAARAAAVANGLPVGKRGRVPAATLTALVSGKMV